MRTLCTARRVLAVTTSALIAGALLVSASPALGAVGTSTSQTTPATTPTGGVSLVRGATAVAPTTDEAPAVATATTSGTTTAGTPSGISLAATDKVLVGKTYELAATGTPRALVYAGGAYWGVVGDAVLVLSDAGVILTTFSGVTGATAAATDGSTVVVSAETGVLARFDATTRARLDDWTASGTPGSLTIIGGSLYYATDDADGTGTPGLRVVSLTDPTSDRLAATGTADEDLIVRAGGAGLVTLDRAHTSGALHSYTIATDGTLTPTAVRDWSTPVDLAVDVTGREAAVIGDPSTGSSKSVTTLTTYDLASSGMPYSLASDTPTVLAALPDDDFVLLGDRGGVRTSIGIFSGGGNGGYAVSIKPAWTASTLPTTPVGGLAAVSENAQCALQGDSSHVGLLCTHLLTKTTAQLTVPKVSTAHQATITLKTRAGTTVPLTITSNCAKTITRTVTTNAKGVATATFTATCIGRVTAAVPETATAAATTASIKYSVRGVVSGAFAGKHTIAKNVIHYKKTKAFRYDVTIKPAHSGEVTVTVQSRVKGHHRWGTVGSATATTTKKGTTFMTLSGTWPSGIDYRLRVQFVGDAQNTPSTLVTSKIFRIG